MLRRNADLAERLHALPPPPPAQQHSSSSSINHYDYYAYNYDDYYGGAASIISGNYHDDGGGGYAYDGGSGFSSSSASSSSSPYYSSSSSSSSAAEFAYPDVSMEAAAASNYDEYDPCFYEGADGENFCDPSIDFAVPLDPWHVAIWTFSAVGIFLNLVTILVFLQQGRVTGGE